jgi:hypothetical protein
MMKRKRTLTIACLVSISAFLLLATPSIEVPPGTTVDVRLTSPVSSQNPSGASVTAVVIVPVKVNGAVAIPVGTKLSGKTADVKAASADDQAATLRLVFDKIQPPGEKQQSLSAQLSSVDNARESVGSDGLITGIVASQTWEGRLNAGLEKLQNNHPGLAGLLQNARDAFVKKVDASINYPAGVDLQLKLTKPLTCNPPASVTPTPEIANLDQLTKIVVAQPDRTSAGDPPKPSDLTNLVFIGSQQDIQNAFKAAGWFQAAERDQASTMETARAIIENRGYQEAPVSILLLDGHPPDLVFEKQTNTFAMRHHIRIWKRPVTFDNKDLWVGAATHDTGIDFSAESHTFTHKIDGNIDNERAKVTNDIIFSGYVSAASMIPRTDVPPNISNATGDKLITDGKMSAMELRDQPVPPATVAGK